MGRIRESVLHRNGTEKCMNRRSLTKSLCRLDKFRTGSSRQKAKLHMEVVSTRSTFESSIMLESGGLWGLKFEV